MFYDALMEKKAAKKKKKREARRPLTPADVNAARLAAGLTGGGVLLSSGLSNRLAKTLRAPTDLDSMVDYTTRIDPRIAYVVSGDINDRAPLIPLNLRHDTPRVAFDADAIKQFEDSVARGEFAFHPTTQGEGLPRGVITAPMSEKRRNPTLLMHELGHATGHPSVRGRAANALYNVGSKLMRGPGTALSLAMGAGGVGGARAAQDEEDLKNVARTSTLMSGLYGAAVTPMLAEEARANIRAVGLGKKLDIPVRKRELAAAMGTYLATAGSQAALPWLLTRRAIKKRRGALKQEKAVSARRS